MPAWLEKLAPILLLLVAVTVVVGRLPKVEIQHSPSFIQRRRFNWITLGMTYAFLYFGRYNLSAILDKLDAAKILTKADFGDIDATGAVVYGVAFLLNGPLTDRLGGRATILIAAVGSALMNLGMAYGMNQAVTGADPGAFKATLLWFNAANMYFQSFGAVSIVKVNAGWFHVRERGVLGGVFGILISLGLYFAYDWNAWLAESISLVAPFYVPAAVLLVAAGASAALVRDTPSGAGFADFDTGDASSGQSVALPFLEVVRRMFSQRVIWLIVAIEFCSGFLRNGVMKWFKPYAKAVGEGHSFVYENWGMLLCIAGILGGVFAGTISDHFFKSRRGPVAAVLYAGLLIGTGAAAITLGTPWLGWSMVFMSLCVIGVHGMLSGTASADFGGSKNAGLATGIIDGFVYLGTAAQAYVFGHQLPTGDAAKDAANWTNWPTIMAAVSLVGLLLCIPIWNARPKSGGGHSTGPHQLA